MTQQLNFEQIRANYLRDLRNRQPAAHIHEGSDNHVRATALAALAEGQYQHQEWVLRQAFADTADSDYLELHAAVYNIRRKPATAASGRVRISGNRGAVLPVGLVLLKDDVSYITTESATLTTTTATVACYCLSAGVSGNQPANTAVRLQSAPNGINSAAVLLSMVGGTDTETDNALRDRLLSRLRRPPAGGNQYDYHTWAMSVPGVESAYVYPLRRGLGTVDIVILTANGLPSAEVIQTVQQYIDERRPVTAKNALVLAPVRVNVPVTVQVSLQEGYQLADVRTALNNALRSYFATVTPGDTVYKSQIEALVSNTAGVKDRVVSSPAGNRTAALLPDVQWLALGTVTVTAL